MAITMTNSNLNSNSTQNVGNNQQQQSSQKQQQQQQSQAYQNAQSMFSQHVKFDPFTSSTGFLSGMSSTYSGTVLKEVQERAIPIMGNLAKELEGSCLLMNKEDVGVAASSLIIAVREKAEPSKVFVHTLIFGSTSNEIRDLVRNSPQLGREFTITATLSNVWDSVYETAVINTVQKVYGSVTVITVGCTTVHQDVNINDDTILAKLVYNAVRAAASEIEVSKTGFTDVSVSDLNQIATIGCKPGFTSGQGVIDYLNNTIRSDIEIVSTLSRKNPQNQIKDLSLNKASNEKILSVARGYVDLMWAGNSNNGFGMIPSMYFNGGNIPPLYNPVFVITSLESDLYPTVAVTLLNIASTLILQNDSLWIQQFRPHAVTNGGIDFKDVGYIGIELVQHLKDYGANIQDLPQGANGYIDIKSSNINLYQLYRYVQMACGTNLAFAMDISPTVADGWKEEVFLSCAQGNTNAKRVIVDAATQLTNGAFTKYYRDEDIFIPLVNKIHFGSFTGQDGTQQDLRNIDYLAVLAASNGDPVMIRDYSDTYTRVNYDPMLRASSRLEILRRITGDAVKVRSVGDRLIFNAAFIKALTSALSEAGYRPRLLGSITPDMGAMRSSYDISSALLAANQQYINVSLGGYNNGVGYNTNYFNPNPSRF